MANHYHNLPQYSFELWEHFCLKFADAKPKDQAMVPQKNIPKKKTAFERKKGAFERKETENRSI